MSKSIKELYIGKTGTGKSYNAMQKALKNKGISIIFTAVDKSLLSDYKNKFVLIDIKDLYDVNIYKKGKYVVYNTFPRANLFEYFDIVMDFLNKNMKLLNKKTTILAFDDGIFEDFNVFFGFTPYPNLNFKQIRLLTALSLHFSKTNIIITILDSNYFKNRKVALSFIEAFGTKYEIITFSAHTL